MHVFQNEKMAKNVELELEEIPDTTGSLPPGGDAATVYCCCRAR
jgi:hypothetical protein